MNKEKANELGHLIAGLILLFPGLDAFEVRDYKSASGYLSMAILFMVVAGIHKSISKKFIKGDAAFFLLEAVTIWYSGWHYKIKGHPVLFYISIAFAAAYLVFSILSFIYEDRPKRKTSRRKRRRSHSSEHYLKNTEGTGLRTSPNDNLN